MLKLYLSPSFKATSACKLYQGTQVQLCNLHTTYLKKKQVEWRNWRWQLLALASSPTNFFYHFFFLFLINIWILLRALWSSVVVSTLLHEFMWKIWRGIIWLESVNKGVYTRSLWNLHIKENSNILLHFSDFLI